VNIFGELDVSPLKEIVAALACPRVVSISEIACLKGTLCHMFIDACMNINTLG